MMRRHLSTRTAAKAVLFFVVLLLAGSAALQIPPVRAQARQVKLALWQQAGWYQPPPPPPPTYEELWEKARYLLDPQARAELLTTHRERTLALLRAELCAPDGGGDEFRTGLLLALEPEEGRAMLRSFIAAERCYWTHHTLGAVATLLTDAELRELALTEPSHFRAKAYELVKAKDDAFVEAFLSQPRNQGAYEIEYLVGLGAAERLYHRLTREGKLRLIHGLDLRQSHNDSLLRLLALEDDSGIRQEILYRTGDTDRLMAEMERHGAFPGNSFWQQWEVERQLAERYPGSLLARGIGAYEAVRGEPYFSESRQRGRGRFPAWEFGDRTYDPDREIPGWLAFLKQYPNHPAADDAAYRLGRSYEITGKYVEALRWLHTATRLPDGELTRQARGRIIWILDAVMAEEALSALPLDQLPEDLRPQAAYSLALRHLRAGRYGEALAALDRLLGTDRERPVAVVDGIPQPPYSHVLRQQRELTARLLELSAKPDPESQYALAATMFHNPELFEHQLWFTGVGYGRFSGHAVFAMYGGMDEAYTRWMAGSSNYIQAARAFARLEGAPEEIAAKAAYSRALALAKLLRPGTVIGIWKPETQIAAEAIDLFKGMASRFPNHELADDALLSLAYLTRDPAYFERILREYPDSDTAADARLATFPIMYEYGNAMVPYRILRLEEAPEAVARWAEVARSGQPHATLTHEGHTYVLLVAPGPHRITASVWPDGPDRIRVSASVSADPGGPGYLLIRLHDATRRVRIEL